MPRRLVCSILTCIFAGVPAALAAADEPSSAPFVSAVRHPSLELIDDGQHDRLLIPLDFAAGVDAKTLSVNVLEVLHGDRLDTQLIQAFHPAIEPLSGVTMTVDYSLVKRPGIYNVVMELSEKAGVGKAPPRRQRVPIALSHPSAKVRVPTPVLIIRTVGVFGSTEVAPAVIKIFEESRRSRALVRFETVTAPSHDGLPVAATVGFKPATAPAGESIDATQDLGDGFPIGSTKATLAARADQMDEAVTFEVEVRSKRPGWLVFPIVLLSALLGWFFRIYLKRLEDSYALVEQAESLIVSIEAEQRLALPEPGDLLKAAAAALDQAIASRKDKDVTDAIAAGNAVLAESQAKRKQWRADTLEALGKDRVTLSAAWRLPVDANLDAMRAVLADAIAHARAGNVVATEAAHRKLSDRLKALLPLGDEWGERATHALTDAEEALGAALGAVERPVVKAATEAAAAAAALDSVIDPGLDALLRTLHVARATAVDYASEVRWRLGKLATPVANALGDPDYIAPLERAAALAGDPQLDPLAMIAAIPATVSTFRKALEKAIAEVLPQPSKEVATELGALMNAGKFVEAAQRASAAAPKDDRAPISSRRNRNLAGPDRPEPSKSPDLSVGATVQQFVIDDAKEPAVVRRVQAFKRLVRARLLRGTVAALIAAGGTTLLYYDTFVGTAAEILGLAAVAFMSDFTFESAFDAILKRRG